MNMFSTYSDISLGIAGMGYAFVVATESNSIYRQQSGLFEHDCATVDAELFAIAEALKVVPCGAEVDVYSDLSEIEKIMECGVSYSRSLQIPVQIIQSIISESGLNVDFEFMDNKRPEYYKMCHRLARRRAKGF